MRKNFLRFSLMSAGMMILSLALFQCAAPSQDPDMRAKQIGVQLRCPVCRGVSISDSPSTLAQEMMGIVRQQISEGKADDEVLQYFEDRYGQWILLKPKPKGTNLIVWLLPLLFIVGGGVVIVLAAKKMKSRRV